MAVDSSLLREAVRLKAEYRERKSGKLFSKAKDCMPGEYPVTSGISTPFHYSFPPPDASG